MITWIQKYFQQHFRIIFSVLLVITIVSFVFTIGASNGMGRADNNLVQRPFFGLNLAAPADAQRIYGDAELSIFANYGVPQVPEETLKPLAEARYAAIHLANQLHLPTPSQEQLTAHIKTIRQFQGREGAFDAEAYNRFRELLKSTTRFRESELFRVLGDDYRANLVRKLFAGPGYVLPADVRKQIDETDTEWAIAIASIPYESYTPSITPTEEQLNAFYEQNKARYEIPSRFSGSYVLFKASDYLAKVTLNEDETRRYYSEHKARFTPAPKDANAAQPDEAAAFEAAKPAVEAALRLERARRQALREATELAIQLDDKQATAATLPQLIAERGLSLLPLKPFGPGESPAELGASAEVSSEAFKLGANRLFSDGLHVAAGAIVLVWNETIPARAPELAEIKARVSADFVNNERRTRFAELGKTLRGDIVARMKAGAQFSQAATAAAAAHSVKVEFSVPPAFTPRQPAKDVSKLILGALASLEKGGVSDMRIENQKGYLVYAANKTVPPADPASPVFIETNTKIAQMASALAGEAVLSELVETEVAKSTPIEP